MMTNATVSLASIPQRQTTLHQIVDRILPQCDRLNVYLNNYPNVPEFLRHPKITVARSQDHGDIGDNGKFFWIHETKGYCFTLDDDVLPSTDYIEQMIGYIEKYNGRVVIANHGSVFNPTPIKNYFTDRQVIQDVPNSVMVNGVGTGSIGWHSGAIRLSLQSFPFPNMTDVWFAIAAKQQEVPLIVMPHRNRRIQVLQTNSPGLFEKFRHNANTQTNLINSNGPWPHPDTLVMVPYRYDWYDIRGYHQDDHLLREMRKRNGFYEQDLLIFLLGKLAPGGVIIDIGANIGNHSIFFANECEADHVIAVEPFPPLQRILARNLARNVDQGGYTIVCAAVYPNRNQVGLQLADDKNIGKTSTVPDSEGDVCVPALPLDAIVTQCAGAAPIALIKMDIEGAELPALQSGIKTIQTHKPLLAIESWTIEDREKIREFLSPYGYRCIGRFCSSPVYVWEAKK
jgi:FkbM family methyltransferase